MQTGDITAGKIVPKSLLTKSHQKEKMSQEIRLHKGVSNPYLVKLYSYFEDNNFVYIVLELCRKRSLMELHKRRKAITEPETRYFMRHILLGVLYLHENKIIHRDLKLGNVFLNDNMECKIGDFGLATKVDYDGERKRTLCGTPNYIAPEVLTKKGHSFEVDIWSIGCILYTLLVGKPPFETQTLKDTYTRIRRNEDHIPTKLSQEARNLITRLLQGDPAHRPNCEQILQDPFFTSGYRPTRLPVSCLTMTPRFDQRHQQPFRRPLQDANCRATNAPSPREKAPPAAPAAPGTAGPPDCYLSELYSQVAEVVACKPDAFPRVNEDEAEDPNCTPMVWVIKWVDYSDKYGLGYQLCDDSIGVLFNDFTKIQLLRNEEDIHYIERNNTEHYHTLSNFPPEFTKKVTLLKSFRNYMNEHLMRTCGGMAPREGDELARMPSLRTYFRTRSAIVLHLTNGTLQINFFADHTKIILCLLMAAVTYIDQRRNSRTFKFELIKQHGCGQDLMQRLVYAHSMVKKMIEAKER